MKRVLAFLAGFAAGLTTAYYAAWFALYRHLTRGGHR